MTSLRVHFMGIGGSGMSATAGLAHKFGYDVDGCDIDPYSAYAEKLRDRIKILKGHSPNHLKKKDILVVTPAIYYKYPPETEIAKSKNTITWHEFLARYLHKDKEVICVSGTHGKSTTTALLSLVFSEANKKPSAMVGATVKEWGENYKAGKGDIFITEADEFHDNFLSYSPDAIILNNIEYDHPDYFKTPPAMIRSFKKHILSLKGKKILVANRDSKPVRALLVEIKKERPDINIYTYTVDNRQADFKAEIMERSVYGARFRVATRGKDIEEEFKTSLAGDFNVSNIVGVVALSLVYSIESDVLRKVIRFFNGIGRRLELLGVKKGVYVYDDYAHHPTAIYETIKAVRQKHPISRIYAVVEPHSYSRTKRLLKDFANAFGEAYSVVIAPIFRARDKEDFGLNESVVAGVINNDRVWAGSFDQIASTLPKELKKKDVVLVMGAGKSSILAKKILKAI